MLTALLILVLFLASWVLAGWVLDDIAEEARWRAEHPPRSHPDHTDTVPLPIGGPSWT